MIGALFRSKISKIIAAIAVVLTAVALSGCGASLTVYDYTSGGVHYNMYELAIDEEIVAAMEESAAVDDNGKKYTVESYFYAMFTSYGCELVDAAYTDGKYVVSYRKAYNGATDLETIGTEVQFEYTSNQNPFVGTIDAISPNPFNGVRAAYDSVLPDQSSTLIQQLKNGRIAVDEYGERIVQFPSVTEAFPYLRDLNAGGLLLNYVMSGSKRMKTSGRQITVSGSNAEYMFSHYFDGAETSMRFRYNRPVVYGWYIVAIVAGVATVAVIVLLTRKKKPKKPTLLERFPYNPEEYRDYDSHLPTKL